MSSNGCFPFKYVSKYALGLDSFKKSVHPCALDNSSLSIRRVNTFKITTT